VGISLEDDTPQTRQFVAKQGDSLDNWVAVDASGTARRALMDAAGVSGIPHAFVIDAKGIVQHHGHPMLPRFDSVVLAVRYWSGEAKGKYAFFEICDEGSSPLAGLC
jgi:hypothetical protein